jgi:transposase
MNGKPYSEDLRRNVVHAIESVSFLAYVEDVAHKVKGVRQAIEARGAILLYLPRYTPELNPIEQFFSKLKALLRKAAAHSIDQLRGRHRLVPRGSLPERMRRTSHQCRILSRRWSTLS